MHSLQSAVISIFILSSATLPLNFESFSTSPIRWENQSTATSSAPTTWAIDDTHSMCLFRVQHFGAGMFWGRIDGVTGTITTNGSPSDSLSMKVTVDANSVSSGNKDLDAHLRSPDFFSVKEFPEMTFTSTSSKKIEGNTWAVTGDFVMHGIKKQITVNVEMTGQSESPRGKKIGFETVLTIDRSDFGMSYGIEKNSIGNSVRLIIALEAASK